MSSLKFAGFGSSLRILVGERERYFRRTQRMIGKTFKEKLADNQRILRVLSHILWVSKGALCHGWSVHFMCSLPLRPNRHAISSTGPPPMLARAVFLRFARRRRASNGPGTQLPWRRWPLAKRRNVAASKSSLIQGWSSVAVAGGFRACR